MYANTDYQTITVTPTSVRFSYALRVDIAGLTIRIPEAVRKQQDLIRTLEADIKATKSNIARMTAKLGIAEELLDRYQVRKQLTELKAKRKRLQSSLDSGQRQVAAFGHPDIAFSGKLVLRKIPSGIPGR